MEREDSFSEFVSEARDQLADIENALLAIEAGGAGADLALVDKAFRAIHSIKGGAGVLGISALGRLAHHAESALSLLHNRQLAPAAAVHGRGSSRSI